MWTALPGIENLQRNFFNFKYNENKSAIENCMLIQQYAEDLTATGEEVKDSWVMSRMLSMLPSKLHHFRTAWDNVTGNEKSLDNLFERLRLEEDRLIEENQTSDSLTQNAFISKKFKKKCGKKGHMKRTMYKNKPCAKYIEYCKNNYNCKNCKQKGHFFKDCPQRNSDENVSPKSEKFDKTDCDRLCGATQHITSRKDWLINFVKLNKPIVVMIGAMLLN